MNDDRGMMKYQPYQSLTAQGTALARIRKEKAKVDRHVLYPDKIEEIDKILANYGGETVRLIYWRAGFFHEICGKIQKIDPQNRCIYICGLRVSFSEIQDLSVE